MSMKMAYRVFLGLLALGAAACSDAGSQGSGGDGGAGGDGSGGAAGQGGTPSSSASSGSGGSGQGGAGGGTTSSSSGGSDPYEAARQACVDTINAHRATMGLPPYARWKEAEPCVDQQATWDQQNDKPHGSWGMGLYPTCNGSGQNECLGHGAENVSGCLDGMWAERDQTGCSGCDACNEGYNPNCPNCDFYGQSTGDVCGHYVNMSAKYFSKVACGFSAAGGWIAVNFQ
ncbi:hypothetical protein [Polyangium jinanense]|uniref:Uncharacterized protein n=1 Tax=Polyangium jinanense TaxID=2829994 RepID=A0A9X3XDV9_9BACT|nr:hypothetical protein [Polyangium jinanense]MDC3962434.1 hypothetical protein [Polyangium jinanense]MDC3988824.1 hypothetical protein [Polyangium jinanense]